MKNRKKLSQQARLSDLKTQMKGVGYKVNAFIQEMRKALCNQQRRFHRPDHEVVSVHKD